MELPMTSHGTATSNPNPLSTCIFETAIGSGMSLAILWKPSSRFSLAGDRSGRQELRAFWPEPRSLSF
jgi:hypothetical protein